MSEPLTIAVLTGLRPHLLERTLAAFTTLYPDVWDRSNRLVWHNCGDSETAEVLDRYDWHTRHVHDDELPTIGEASTMMAELIPDEGLVLRLEDDLVAQWSPGWDRLAEWLLQTHGQVRLQRSGERASPRNMVTRDLIRWKQREGYRVSRNAHYTHRAAMMRAENYRAIYPAQHERHAAQRYIELGLGSVAQLTPGVFCHAAAPGSDQSLKHTRGAT